MASLAPTEVSELHRSFVLIVHTPNCCFLFVCFTSPFLSFVVGDGERKGSSKVASSLAYPKVVGILLRSFRIANDVFC